MIWAVGSIVLAVIFSVLLVDVIRRMIGLNKSTFKVKDTSFYKDKILFEKETSGQNQVFDNEEDSKTYIDKYVINREKKRKSLLLHILKPIEPETFIELELYNERYEWLETHRVSINEELSSLPLISIRHETDYVRIKLTKDPSSKIDYDVFNKRFNRLAVYESLSLMFLFLPVSYLLLRLITQEELVYYTSIGTLSLGVVLSLVVSIINFLLVKKLFVSYNRRVRL